MQPKTQQTTLKGETIQEHAYYVLGFVSADVVRLKNEEWFTKLGYKQITSVEKFLDSKRTLNP